MIQESATVQAVSLAVYIRKALANLAKQIKDKYKRFCYG